MTYQSEKIVINMTYQSEKTANSRECTTTTAVVVLRHVVLVDIALVVDCHSVLLSLLSRARLRWMRC